MYCHFHCDDQGYDLLAGLFKRTAIEEVLHIDWDTSNGEKILDYEIESGKISEVAFSDNHRFAMVQVSSEDIIVWGLLEGQVNAVEDSGRR